MPSRSKSILFLALIIVAIFLVMVKAEHIWHFFNKEVPPVATRSENLSGKAISMDEETKKIQDNLNRQRREIASQAAELQALSAEIDDKLEALREAEENILRLIQQKEDLAATLHQTPDQAYDLLHQDDEKGEEAKEEPDTGISDELVIIELTPADE